MAVITISRQFGAGGKTLGGKIAKCLGYAFVDEEIIEKVAERAQVSTNWVQSVENEAGGWLMNFINSLVSKSFMERILNGSKGYIDEDVYVQTLREVIHQIAEQDNCVILGRGGQFILKDQKNVFHLLLVAEKEDRIKFMETHYSMPPTQAKNIINIHDKRRYNLLRRFEAENYEQASLYDLVINMSKTPVDKAVDIACKMISR